MSSLEEIAVRISDISQPFDVSLFEQIVDAAYSPGNPQQQAASRILVQLQDHPEMWQRADAILEQATSANAKFLGLIILSEAIKSRWKVLEGGDQARTGIKNFLVQKIIELSSDEATMQSQKMFLQRMNLTLVLVLKHEWPHNWPEFISEIVTASTTNEILCENNMNILKLLSEEVFEVRDQMTTVKTKTLKERLNEEFAQIFNLCDMVLQQSQKPSLLNVTLQTLQRFLTWVPLGYIFETSLIPLLITKFFPVPIFRDSTIECLTEIAGLSDCPEQYNTIFLQLYTELLTQLSGLVQPEPGPINAMFESNGEHTLKLLALFFSSFFKAHLKLLETPESTDALNHGLMYLLCITELPDPEIFKICLEYWHIFANELYTDDSQMRSSRGPLALGMGNGMSRKDLYRHDLLCRLRIAMISNMAKPEEVVVVEDENGDIIREMQKDTEVIAQYKTMREALVYLTHLNYEDTESIMLDKLASQVDKNSNEWSWNNLNTLCWAIGSISGAMSEEEEKRFLVTVIKDLLGLCEEKRGKDNKAVIASNIMYVVGQYPRFLRAHWKFLKTVANKLFEFMHEKHPGVQDMACETFLKIAHKCKRKFVTLQQGETQPFIVELTEMIPSIILELQAHQIQTFYEAAACMLSERTLTGVPGVNAPPLDRQQCLMLLLDLPNQTWTGIMEMASASNGESLKSPDTMRELTRFLKLNIRVCSSVGPLYVTELQVLFGDLMNVYTAYSEYQKLMIDTQGEMATHQSLFKAMRSVKKETLRLLTSFIERCGDPEAPPLSVAQSLMPLLLQSAPASVLGDYHRLIPNARDPEVLALFSACIVKLPLGEIEGGTAVNNIMAALFECTLQMITGNFEDFPELRLQFFTLLKAINSHCFVALFNIPQEHRKLVVDSVAFAVKHTERNVAETGLDILYELLKNVEKTPQVAQEFYQQFLIQLMEQVLYVLTDRLHKSGIKMHASLLQHMLHLVEMDKVTVPLFDPAGYPPGTTNQAYVRDYIGNLLLTQFPNLNKNQVVAFVQGLFNVNTDAATFKQHLRDFLITLKEFSGDEDNAQLYDEETQVQKGEAAAQETARRQAVPGILNPYEIEDMTL
mmetsp:Transcript_19910/g.25976  ORF Transcript_19910/g.25976 Transcript_19910/m.25976 type:complete len:1094 (+) Transcript_19910:217-3498(+)|eukprot:CAMPEP_0114343374 /NCGR_PEP_ID=MMETSP0101-20121206/10553_1 /TAXON_ID=38822 ORGANISM="Pteridomonas danica, Strain PT" /NCGR_SAMPLE_ID=MMETSP0101 /ASSEMBLY_ACC=CAM_ASM_000211 /LENGTH=1093 /DNA_ID=CAMNT_0001478053 /DNA_START=174 /DNA_END=3455 /DNA_ORIENTATION=-